MSTRRRLLGISLAVLLLGFVVGLALWLSDEGRGGAGKDAGASQSGNAPRLTVALVSATVSSDRGYGRQAHEGLRAVHHAFGGAVGTRVVENVRPDQAGPLFEELCEAGTDLIIGSVSEYAESLHASAGTHPEVKFLLCFGLELADNVSTCGVRDWEGAYVCGAVAAMSVSGSALGCVVPHRDRPVPWIVNAFALGARSIRPDVPVWLASIDSWHDPEQEKRAVASLAEKGVGAIYFLTFRPFAGFRAAELADIRVLHHFVDLSEFARSQWLTGTVWHWSPIYLEATRELLDGQWTSRGREGGFREGVVSLASFGPEVTASAWSAAAELVKEISSGERAVFEGPLQDDEGRLRVPEGKTLGPEEVRSIEWLLPGVREVPVEGS